jgi:hypothetical protein
MLFARAESGADALLMSQTESYLLSQWHSRFGYTSRFAIGLLLCLRPRGIVELWHRLRTPAPRS